MDRAHMIDGTNDSYACWGMRSKQNITNSIINKQFTHTYTLTLKQHSV